jgi:hypothetical protein
MRGRNIRIFYDAELELFESLQFCPMSDRSEALKEEISKSGPVISNLPQMVVEISRVVQWYNFGRKGVSHRIWYMCNRG